MVSWTLVSIAIIFPSVPITGPKFDVGFDPCPLNSRMSCPFKDGIVHEIQDRRPVQICARVKTSYMVAAAARLRTSCGLYPFPACCRKGQCERGVSFVSSFLISCGTFCTGMLEFATLIVDHVHLLNLLCKGQLEE